MIIFCLIKVNCIRYTYTNNITNQLTLIVQEFFNTVGKKNASKNFQVIVVEGDGQGKLMASNLAKYGIETTVIDGMHYIYIYIIL